MKEQHDNDDFSIWKLLGYYVYCFSYLNGLFFLTFLLGACVLSMIMK